MDDQIETLVREIITHDRPLTCILTALGAVAFEVPQGAGIPRAFDPAIESLCYTPG